MDIGLKELVTDLSPAISSQNWWCLSPRIKMNMKRPVRGPRGQAINKRVKITSNRLSRQAAVYLRQSSATQVEKANRRSRNM